jgi:uncharacterized membrane protein YcaP (DUF421 family)
MDSVLRAAAVYFFLLVVFRIAGKRSLAQITTFDFVLLLVIGEATQQALTGEDFSMTNAFIVILTLIGLNVLLSELKNRSPSIENWLEDAPVIVVDEGRLLREPMARERIDESDILTAARESHGLERLDQIKYAVLERNGAISIVPQERRQG